MLNNNENELSCKNEFESEIESLEQTILFYDTAIQSARTNILPFCKDSSEEKDILNKIRIAERQKKKQMEKINKFKNNYSIYDKVEFESKIESMEENILFYDVNIETLRIDMLNYDNSSAGKKIIMEKIELFEEKKENQIRKLNKYKSEYSPARINYEREMQALYGPPDILFKQKKKKKEKQIYFIIETDVTIYRTGLSNNSFTTFGKNNEGYPEWGGREKLFLFHFESPDLFGYNLCSDESVMVNDMKMALKYKTKLSKGDNIRFEHQNLKITITEMILYEE